MKTVSAILFSIPIGYLLLVLAIQQPDFYRPALFLMKAASWQISLSCLLLSACLCLWFRTRSALLALFTTLILVFIANIDQWGFSPTSKQPITENNQNLGTMFKVTTFSAMTRTRNGEDILSYSEQQQPDLFCLQEVIPEDVEALHKIYPHSIRKAEQTLMIFSRFPVQLIRSNNHWQLAQVQISDSQNLQVINVHLPRQYQDTGVFKQTWEALIQYLGSLDQTTPILLCGDFNLTPHNSYYEILTQFYHLNDAHIKKGHGWGFTFPSGQRKIAIFGNQIRIDYLLFKNLSILNSDTQNISQLSDHRAVTATFVVD